MSTLTPSPIDLKLSRCTISILGLTQDNEHVLNHLSSLLDVDTTQLMWTLATSLALWVMVHRQGRKALVSINIITTGYRGGIHLKRIHKPR